MFLVHENVQWLITRELYNVGNRLSFGSWSMLRFFKQKLRFCIKKSRLFKKNSKNG